MIGKVDISRLNTPPEKHEFETAKFFAEMGKDIVFLKPSGMPDIHMEGNEWEIKCPEGKSKRTIEENFRKAVRQSRYIIFDLRWVKLPEQQCLSQLQKEFDVRRYLKRLLVIKKNAELFEIKFSQKD